MEIEEYFKSKRFGNSHLGMGDIRLTIGEQEHIVEIINKLSNKNSRKQFLEQTAALIEKHLECGDKRAAEEVSGCRILFERIFCNIDY